MSVEDGVKGVGYVSRLLEYGILATLMTYSRVREVIA